MGALVFVTSVPFAAGEIGRTLHNLLKAMGQQDRARAIVVALDVAMDPADFAQNFPGARLVLVDSHDESGRFDFGGRHPARWIYQQTTPWHWNSAAVFRALRRLAAEQPLDYIEFPDRGGLGFVATQEKYLSDALGAARIAVRLYGPTALLLHHQSSARACPSLALADQERKALRDCDVIVAPLAPVADYVAKWLGFSTEEWTPRVVLHAPPVIAERGDALLPSSETRVVFDAEMQGMNRPDLFIRGFAAFCNTTPDFRGKARLPAQGEGDDPTCREAALRLIPDKLAARYDLAPPRAGAASSHCIFVAPGVFDAFCLSAYEASRLGAVPVLNRDNPAFGERTPWIDGVNCVKFEGGALNLGRALQRALALRRPLSAVEVSNNPWPWTAAPFVAATAPMDDEKPLVSVIVPHFNLADYLPDTLTCLRAQTYKNIEIIVIDDASTDEASAKLLARLRGEQHEKFRLIESPGNVGLSAVRNLGVAAARGRYILPLDADDVIDPRFIALAVRALERHRQFDMVVTQAAYFEHVAEIPAPGEARDLDDFAVFIGEPKLAGVRENRFSTCSALIRAELLRANPYAEAMRAYEDWSLYLRLVQRDARVLVTTDALFFYRNRPASMVKEDRDPARRAQFVHDMLRNSVDVSKLPPLAYLAFSPPPPVPPVVVEHRIDVCPFDMPREAARRLLIKAAKREILLCRIKRFLMYPLARPRRHQRKRLREWKSLLRDIQGWR